MSDFQVNVVRVSAIEPIEGADRIELAVVGEYRSIVGKGSFKTGDLAVYLPEQAVLPEWLIVKLNLVGKLSGGQKNRIKAVKLRGCLSQGILLPPADAGDGVTFVLDRVGDGWVHVEEGDDVAEFLGVKKYDPTENMTGEQRKKFYGNCAYIGGNKTVHYDLENWKKHSQAFSEGDDVVITEKLHGTLCCFAYYPGLGHPDLPDDVFVYSKGLGKQGQVFKWVNEDGTPQDNVYLRAFHGLTRLESHPGYDAHTDSTVNWDIEATIIERAIHVLGKGRDDTFPIFIFGEVHGIGVQDLGYGESSPKFRAFDMWIDTPQSGHFVDAADKYALFDAMGVDHVPILYRGPFSRETMLSLTDGKTTLGAGHIREGVVITSAREEHVHRLGRKILKNVSGDYLTRKGDVTEFN